MAFRITVFFVFMMAACLHGYGSDLSSQAEKRMLSYDAEDSRKAIDLYLPTKVGSRESKHPYVVYIHGGGWSGGSRDNLLDWRKEPVLEALLSHGVAVAAVEYGLVDETVTLRDQVGDIRRAVRHLQSNACRHGLDPARYLLWGDSAGGHLALLSVAPLQGNPSAVDPQALVLWYPATDLTDVVNFNSRFRNKRIQTFGHSPEKAPDWYAEFSPVTYASSYRLPITIYHGTADPIISHDQVVRFTRLVNASGGQVDLRDVKKGIHGFQKESGSSLIEPGLPAIRQETVKTMCQLLQAR